MSILLLVCAIVSMALVPSAAQAAPLRQGPQDPAELEAFLDGLAASQMDEHHIAGMVVSVVKDGSLFLAKGYGYADLEARIPVDAERTIFRPGSVSKLFTWTAVMQLVEQGRLSLDEDVNTYIDFSIPPTFDEPVTLRYIITHTPGFEDRGENLFKLDPAEVPSLESYLKENMPARVFPPGELGAYSNYGTALAGYIVQRVSGIPFADYIDENIFTPLGMEHSTFKQPLPEGLAPQMSGGYNFFNGAFLKGGFEYVAGLPAGSLSSTAADMARFMIAHLQDGQYNGGRILEEDTAIQMHQQLFTHDPRIHGMAYGFFEDNINGQRVISHGGDTILFHSNLFLLPDEDVGLFISTNTAGGGTAGVQVFNAFMDRYYPVEETEALQPPPGFAERFAPYVGQYTLARSNFTGFEKIISLFSSTNVSLNEDGYVVANMMGEANQFVEVEPGLLQDISNPDNKLVYQTREDGQAYLLLPLPFAMFKTPWYGTTSFQALLLVLVLAVFIATLVGWLIAGLLKWRKREPRRLEATLARSAAVLFGVLILVFVAGFLSVFGNINPAYGVPMIFFADSPALNFLLSLTSVLAVLGAGMLVFAILAWGRGYWRIGGRLHYSLLAVAALAFLWQLAYWNLLF